MFNFLKEKVKEEAKYCVIKFDFRTEQRIVLRGNAMSV